MFFGQRSHPCLSCFANRATERKRFFFENGAGLTEGHFGGKHPPLLKRQVLAQPEMLARQLGKRGFEQAAKQVKKTLSIYSNNEILSSDICAAFQHLLRSRNCQEDDLLCAARLFCSKPVAVSLFYLATPALHASGLFGIRECHKETIRTLARLSRTQTFVGTLRLAVAFAVGQHPHMVPFLDHNPKSKSMENASIRYIRDYLTPKKLRGYGNLIEWCLEDFGRTPPEIMAHMELTGLYIDWKKFR